MATIADLNVNIGVSGVQTLDAGLQRASKSVGDLGRETDKAADKIEKASANTSKGFSAIGSSLSGISGAIAGAFTVGALLQFGNAVINTTAQFQKMEAVLTNTLGSSSQAQSAMLMIQDIAAKTPFSVEQLTESFVKLANRGITPTGDQIVKLGDLAASTGKDFDQLTEAMLDAMTGEFERLKEFGIQASANGDKVAFTFKGVTTEVAKTDTAIKDYILSLGDAQGVSGSMAGISETLGGKISNLGDTFSQLFKTIGEGTDGPLNAFIDRTGQAVKKLRDGLTSNDQLAKEAASSGVTEFGKMIEGELKKVGDKAAAAGQNANAAIAAAMSGMAGKIKQNIASTQKEIQALEVKGRLLDPLKDRAQFKANNKEAQDLRERLALYKGELAVLGELAAKSTAKTTIQAKEVTTLETLKAKLKTLQDQQEGMDVSDKKGLITKNQEIQKLEDLIKKYEGLGIAKGKATKFDGPKAQDIRQALPMPELDNTQALGADIGLVIPAGLQEQVDAIAASFNNTTSSARMFRDSLIDLKVNAEDGIASFFTDNLGPAINGVGDALFNAFSGEAPGKQFFASLIKMFAQAAAEYGKLTMALGVAKVAVGDFSGIGAIAAGAALIAAAGIASGAASRAAGGGGGGGVPRGNSSYSAPTSRASAGGQAYSGPMQLVAETRLAGADIVISYERAKAQNNRRG